MPAAILYTVISIGFISAKFWLAMKLGMLKELRARLVAKQFVWSKNLDKPINRTSFWHKFMIAISIITSISLSVVSVGDAVRKNQNEIKKANEAIAELSKLITANNLGKESQRNIIYKTASINLNSGDKAIEQAEKIWPIMEAYRKERAEFEEIGIAFNSKDEIEWKGKLIIPDSYWDHQNSLVIAKVKAAGRTMNISQIRNITSKTALAQIIKNEIENLSKNKSSEGLALLDKETRSGFEIAIQNLKGRFKWPESYGGKIVEFPANNPSGALTMLKDVKAAYENDNGDIGDSAKMFMLIGPSIENAFKAKVTLENISEKGVSTSSFGATEIMIMVFILIVGIGQEFLIAHFTPKATIDRNLLRQVSEYLLWENKDQKERFLLGVYDDYYGDGVFNQDAFEHKCKKAVDHLERNIDDTIAKYSKYNKPVEQPKEPKKARQIKEPVPVQAQEEKPVLNDRIIEESEVAKPESARETENQEKFDNELDALIKEAESRLEE